MDWLFAMCMLVTTREFSTNKTPLCAALFDSTTGHFTSVTRTALYFRTSGEARLITVISISCSPYTSTCVASTRTCVAVYSNRFKSSTTTNRRF